MLIHVDKQPYAYSTSVTCNLSPHLRLFTTGILQKTLTSCKSGESEARSLSHYNINTAPPLQGNKFASLRRILLTPWLRRTFIGGLLHVICFSSGSVTLLASEY